LYGYLGISGIDHARVGNCEIIRSCALYRRKTLKNDPAMIRGNDYARTSSRIGPEFRRGFVNPGMEIPYTRRRRDPEIGQRILRGSSSSFLQGAAEIALAHHEKWDGGGYPAGLSGKAIPFYGRIAAVADVFDALLSKRSYKEAWPLEQARDYVGEQAGKHFDPRTDKLFFSSGALSA